MDMDEDDDLYVPEEPNVAKEDEPTKPTKADDLEEGEEEDESGAMDEDSDSDSDIDIITERKDGSKAAPPPQSKYSDIRNIPQRTTSQDGPTTKAAPVKKDDEPASNAPNVAAPSADKASAAASKSTIDLDADPVHPGSGKPISQVNIDEDLPDSDKPWRKPGTDISDYFNYGFDEFTWALYASKQDNLRSNYGADAMSGNKMMEDLSQMMMGGMGMPGGGNVGGGGMPGMDGMPPEMQAMMQQMMASGMDPSQMDPSQMNAMFSGMQNAGGNGGAQGNQGQNFGGGGGFGGNQGFGYDQNMAGGGGGGGGGGGRGGFGRGRRGRW